MRNFNRYSFGLLCSEKYLYRKLNALTMVLNGNTDCRYVGEVLIGICRFSNVKINCAIKL